LCGTPEYLAPEIIQSKGHGISVDWWALGILVYEMLVGYPPFYDDTPMGIYQKVLAGRIEFPKHVESGARDIIRRLLAYDRSKRYGCMSNGAEDVKSHPWFNGIDWNVCLQKGLTPPYVPPTASPDDTSLYDQYPESIDGVSSRISADEQAKFFDDF